MMGKVKNIEESYEELLKDMHYLECSYEDLLGEYYFLEICNSVLINEVITKSEVEEIYGHEISCEDYARKMKYVSRYIKSKMKGMV